MDELVQLFDNLMVEHATRVNEAIADGQMPESWRRLDYRRNDGVEPGPEEYGDADFNAYYMYRFGYAYAFEYYLIYDAIFRSYSGNEGTSPVLGVTSVGCGSMIDAWSLAYAKARIDDTRGGVQLPEGLSLRYSGYDLTRWSTYFAGRNGGTDCEQAIQNAVNAYYVRSARINDFSEDGVGVDITQLFDRNHPQENFEQSWRYYNVITFGKILNELPNDVLETTIENISDAAREGCFDRDERYLVFSHSITSLDDPEEGYLDIAQRVVEAINYDNRYEVDGSIMEQSPYYGIERGMKLKNENADELHKIYVFDRPYTNRIEGRDGYYGELLGEPLHNTDFSGTAMDDVMQGDMGQLRQRIKRVSYYAIQVIKLTRRN